MTEEKKETTYEERHDGLYTDYGQKIRGRQIDIKALKEKLGAAESTMCRDALEVIERYERLLLPVYMGVTQEAMVGNNIPDDARIFNFMGSGASDFTFMAEFRSLMGDERVSIEESMKAYEAAMQEEDRKMEEAQARGECNLKYGHQEKDHTMGCELDGVNTQIPEAGDFFDIDSESAPTDDTGDSCEAGPQSNQEGDAPEHGLHSEKMHGGSFGDNGS